MKKFWACIIGLSMFFMLACAIVAYADLTISMFTAGNYLLGAFLTALFVMILSCVGYMKAIKPKKGG